MRCLKTSRDPPGQDVCRLGKTGRQAATVGNNLSRFRSLAKRIVGLAPVPDRVEVTIQTDQLVIVRRCQPVRARCENCGGEAEVVSRQAQHPGGDRRGRGRVQKLYQRLFQRARFSRPGSSTSIVSRTVRTEVTVERQATTVLTGGIPATSFSTCTLCGQKLDQPQAEQTRLRLRQSSNSPEDSADESSS